jgi:glycosyltransferase involved in cell wall biosynthesis
VLEIIDSGIDGLLCHTEELGSALSRVLSDSVLREKLARGGLEKVKRCFSMQTIAEQYELLYHTMVASS